MAKQQRDETISSVSDVLGFILEQSEKEPDKRRPIKPDTSDLQAESEYVSAIVDALAMPGTFVGDQTLGTIQKLVDAEAKIKTQGSRIPAIKMKASDLPAFFDNPDEFVDKLFEKNKKISKMQRLRWAGEQMRMLAGSTYAKKLELFDEYSPDMKNVLERGLGQAAMEGSEKDIAWVMEASEKLMQKGHVKGALDRLKSELASTQDPRKRKNLSNRIKNIEGSYNLATQPNRSIQGFRGLLKEEFRARQEDVIGSREKKDLSAEEIREYEKMETAKGTVDLWGEYDGLPKTKREFNRIQNDIVKTKNALAEQKEALQKGNVFTTPDGKKIDYSRYSSDQRKEELRAVQGRIKDLSNTSKGINRTKFWSNLGKAEGTYYGIKNTFGAGGLEAMLNGDFFDPKYDYFGSPSDPRGGKFSLLKSKHDEAVDFVKPNVIEGRDLINTYNEAMVGLYYINPTTWIRSLASGEGFAWMAHKQQQKLANMWGVKAGMFTELKDRKFWTFYKQFKGASVKQRDQLLDKNPEYRKLMGRLMKVLGDKDSNMYKKFKRAEKFYASVEKWGGLARVFSAPARFKARVISGFQKKVREKLFTFLSSMKMFTSDKAAMALLKSWKLSGGRALTGAISKAIVSALGLAGTAIGGPLGAAISLAVAAVLDKVLKISIKVFIYGFVGIFGFIMVIAAAFSYNKRASVDAYSRELAGEIYYNEFDSYGGGEGNDGPGGGIPSGPPIIPPPSGEECMLGAHSLRCTQGFGGGSCFSHGSITTLKPVDLAPVGWIEAPQFCDDPGAECVIQSTAPFYCGKVPGGYHVWFSAFDGKTTYKFHFVHTILGGDYSQGDKVRAGQPFAFVQQELTWNSCWQGAHLHLETLQNGEYVDPLALLQSFNCSVPSHSGCANCVGGN